MADYGSTDRVRRSAAEEYIAPARSKKQSTVTIHTGVFEKSLVLNGVLQPNRFPIVCNALKSRKFLTDNNLTLLKVQAPPSGQSSTVSYTYKLGPELPAKTKAAQASPSPSFLKLRGILKRTYQHLGGAETFHKAERESWD
jgi:hypothetical protein